jgi:hypothetical protein
MGRYDCYIIFVRGCWFRFNGGIPAKGLNTKRRRTDAMGQKQNIHFLTFFQPDHHIATIVAFSSLIYSLE